MPKVTKGLRDVLVSNCNEIKFWIREQGFWILDFRFLVLSVSRSIDFFTLYFISKIKFLFLVSSF